MKIKRTVYHKEGYKKIGQEVEFELTFDELEAAYYEYSDKMSTLKRRIGE